MENVKKVTPTTNPPTKKKKKKKKTKQNKTEYLFDNVKIVKTLTRKFKYLNKILLRCHKCKSRHRDVKCGGNM